MNPALMNRYTTDVLQKLNQPNPALRLVYSDDQALNAALDAVLAADRVGAKELRQRGRALHDEMRADEHEGR